ncbi:MAG TPA: diacylglycerol kinase family protein [Candidatus Saccharimonadales bacterium]|nr:diacylglycerol kinase family protein [Candidatus Saccharimonadales bacterium]
MTHSPAAGSAADESRKSARQGTRAAASMVVIWNGAAGQKAGVRTNSITEPELRGILADHGLEARLVETDSPDSARDAARAAVTDGCQVVVAAGGDGTVGAVAEALLGTEAVLGILPLGSVMNIARSLGLPRDVRAAAADLAAGRVRSIDVGETDQGTFLEAGSIGMNAAMFREAQRFDDGDPWSILRTIWVALRYRPARMVLELDDRVVRTRALMVTVSNGPYTGLGMSVAPDARLDDGRFDVRVFRGFSKWELLRHLGSIAFGRRRYAPHVSTYRSARVRASSAHPLPCRADSHDLGTTPIEFRTRPGALRVVIGGDGAAAG